MLELFFRTLQGIRIRIILLYYKKDMKKILLVIVIIIAAFLVFSYTQRSSSGTIDSDISFGFLPANNPATYQDLKELGVRYIMIDTFSEIQAAQRLAEAQRQGLKVYLSAGILSADDFERMKLFGSNPIVEGFFLDEPHVHTVQYDNGAIEKWIEWSTKTFPNKKIFIATPRESTYTQLQSIPSVHKIGFQPDSYPIWGLIHRYKTQRDLVQKMLTDGYEVQPIIQTHALNKYETGIWRKIIDIFARVNAKGMTECPTPQQVVNQIRNVAFPEVKIIWMYPGEDAYVSWTPERKTYIQNVFDLLEEQGG